MELIVENAGRFLSLANQLRNKGFKNKDLAIYLNMPAPVYSSIYKTILPYIEKINNCDSVELETQINQAFDQVNNVSKKKLNNNIESYIKTLENLLTEKPIVKVTDNYLDFLKTNSEQSFDFINRYYSGIYYFYYISSDQYKIKGEPFLLRPDNERRIMNVYKGNKHSQLQYSGLVTMLNTHTLTFHIKELQDNPEDVIFAHLSLPYIKSVDFLRGVFTNINLSRQPIGRKVVLKKISDNVDFDFFENIIPEIFNENFVVNNSEIATYLEYNALIECYNVSKPHFNISDLLKETEISMCL